MMTSGESLIFLLCLLLSSSLDMEEEEEVVVVVVGERDDGEGEVFVLSLSFLLNVVVCLSRCCSFSLL